MKKWKIKAFDGGGRLIAKTKIKAIDQHTAMQIAKQIFKNCYSVEVEETRLGIILIVSIVFIILIVITQVVYKVGSGNFYY